MAKRQLVMHFEGDYLINSDLQQILTEVDEIEARFESEAEVRIEVKGSEETLVYIDYVV